MMRCKYWDCGWCYCKTGNSNDINGKCMTPDECHELRSESKPEKQNTSDDSKVTEQNIRDEFEVEPEHSVFDLSKRADGEYDILTTYDYHKTFKSDWIAAFKVILENENE